MVTRKNLDKICVAAAILAVLIAVLFMNGERLGLMVKVDSDAEAHSDDAFFTNNDLDGSWDTSSATQITLQGDHATYSGSGVYTSGSDVFIASSGAYVVSGTLDGGTIHVSANDNSKVWVLFDGVTINRDDDACFVVDEADKVFLTLADKSTNTLTSGSQMSSTALEDGVDGTIFAHDDLTINGSGSLTVTAGYKHGISANDDLVVTGGNLTVTAPTDGLHANDSLRVCSASISVDAKDDGLASDNDGSWVYIESGTINVTAADECIVSPGDVTVVGGDLTLSTGTESGHHGLKAGQTCNVCGGTIKIPSCYGGIAAVYINMTGGDVNVTPADDGLNASDGSGSGGMAGGMGGGRMGGGANATTDATGTTDTTTNGDASAPTSGSTTDQTSQPMGRGPMGGTQSTTGTNGGSTDGSMPEPPSGGMGTSTDGSRPEPPSGGMGGTPPDMGGQTNDQTGTTTDGSTGSTTPPTPPSGDMGNGDSQSMTPPSGQAPQGNGTTTQQNDGTTTQQNGGATTGTSSSTTKPWVHISGGTLTIVNENGHDADGIDSNGDIVITSGDIRVSLVNDGSNLALDYGSESGGVCEISGGTIVAAGSSGMIESVSSSSAQASILMLTSSEVQAGSTVQVRDASGTTILSHEVPCTFNSVTLSCPDMQVGQTYTVTAGSETQEATLSSVVSQVGQAQGGGIGQGGGMGHGQMGTATGDQSTTGTQPTDGQQPTDGTQTTSGQTMGRGQRPTTGDTTTTDGTQPTTDAQTQGQRGGMGRGQQPTTDTSETTDDKASSTTQQAETKEPLTAETIAIYAVCGVALAAALALVVRYRRH